MHRAPTRRAPPGLRPGERMVNGYPHVFSLDLLRSYLAACEVADAPDDLTQLSWNELSVLFNSYLRLRADRPDDADVVAFGARVCNERARRPEYAVYAGRVS